MNHHHLVVNFCSRVVANSNPLLFVFHLGGQAQAGPIEHFRHCCSFDRLRALGGERSTVGYQGVGSSR